LLLTQKVNPVYAYTRSFALGVKELIEGVIGLDVAVPAFVLEVTWVDEVTPLNSRHVTIAFVGVPERVIVIGLVVATVTISSYTATLSVAAEEVSVAEFTSVRACEPASCTDVMVLVLGSIVKETTMRSPTVGCVPNEQVNDECVLALPWTSWTNWTCLFATVKVAEAAFASPSVAETVWPPVGEDDGTTKVALKPPVPEVVTVVGFVTCVAPLNLIVIVEEPAKPVPVTVTVVRTGPVAGFSVIAGVTVNVAEAVLAPSEAVTVFAPTVDAGTAKVALNPPEADAVTVAGDVDWATPLNLIVIVEPGMKLVPVTVTVVPTAPVTGFRLICEVVTWNEAEVTTLVPWYTIT
jgi:hypothetical protein